MSAIVWQMFAWIKSLLGKFRPDSRGGQGEMLAQQHLREVAGLTILACNWRSPRDRRDELDLVALDGAVLVFVEVKTRTKGARVPGYYAVNARKKRVVLRAAKAYLRGLPQKPRTVRFDIVEVALSRYESTGTPEVRHFANVPLFPKSFRPDA
jgi:putative endonuclease